MITCVYVAGSGSRLAGKPWAKEGPSRLSETQKSRGIVWERLQLEGMLHPKTQVLGPHFLGPLLRCAQGPGRTVKYPID